MDRRSFLSLLPGAALATLSANAKDKPTMLPIIDTHQHLWDLSKIKLSWGKEGDPLHASHTPIEYAAAIDGLNVVKSVYMEVDVIPEHQQAEADYVIEICKSGKTPMVAAVIGGHPATTGFRTWAEKFRGSPYVKGIRQVLHAQTPRGHALEPAFVADLKLLGELGLSFDLCVRPAELPDYVKLLDLCPGTRFILDHCGNAPVREKNRTQWEKDIVAIAEKKNVVCKVSGIVAGAEKGKWTPDDLAPIINHVLDSFGPDRVMFGGDWPVCTRAATYKEWVSALQTIVASRKLEDQKKLFHDNAAKFYGI